LSKLGLDVCRKIPQGSILYTCTGSTIGKIGIAGKLLTTNQQINSIVVNSNFSSEYIYYALQTRKDDIKKLAAVQAVPLITKGNFSRTKLANPSLRLEQERIATALSDIDDLILNIAGTAMGFCVFKFYKLVRHV
jgi:type I restriction enzyme S subunit